MFYAYGRSQKKWLEEQGLVDFIQKDMRKRQLYYLSTFSSGEDLFQDVMNAEDYESMLHLGLMHYLSMLYEEEIKPPKENVKEEVHIIILNWILQIVIHFV